MVAEETLFINENDVKYFSHLAPGIPGLEGRCNRERTAFGLTKCGGPTDGRKDDNDGRDERGNGTGRFPRDSKRVIRG